MSRLNTILVVDDDRQIHTELAQVAGSKGWEMKSAYDGQQGWDMLRASPFDLVLTGVRIPNLNGLDLLERLRELRPETKVIVMTGAATPESVIRAMRDRAYSFIGKPFSQDAIRDVIQQALESPSWQDDIEVLSARPSWISLRVRCKLETADRVTHFLREMEMDQPHSEREQIAIAVRELLMNAIEYGGKSDPNQTLYVSCVRGERANIYYIRDPGNGFSFDQLAHAAISNSPGSPADHIEIREKKGMRPGGFGILLARKLADELLYNEKGNEVILIKYRRSD